MSKSNIVKVCLLGLSLIWFSLGNTNGVRITSITAAHQPRMYTLYLWADEDVWIKTSDNNLIITNWMVVWDMDSYSRSTAASIWWWVSNRIDSNSNYAWIWWGEGNSITNWENSIIWWWLRNAIYGQNAVVAWWTTNESHSWGSVMWWSENVAESNWVVLWWYNNAAYENSLALWKDANAVGKSFAWNATADANSARIDASNWILIWTTIPITWVNLVVNWAIKIWWTSSATWVAWEIRFVSGCFYAYDWIIWHIINRNSTWSCNAFTVSEVCKFGNIELQEWDVVTWYKAIISTNCDADTNKRSVKCTAWELLDSSWNTWFTSPYCYTWLWGWS